MNQVATKPRDPILVLREQLDAKEVEFASFLPSTLPVARFKNVVLTAVTQNPDLLGADRVTFFNSCRKAALDGLAPDGKEAALVIYRTKKKNDRGQEEWIDAVQYLPMKEGLLKKVRNSGKVKDLTSEVVRANDKFQYGIVDGVTILNWQPYLGADEPGPIIAAFSIATFLDGDKSYKVMSIRDIERIRLQASKQKDDKTGEPKSAWKNYYPEMCCKTVIKRHCSELPQSTDLDDLVRNPERDFDEVEEGERASARPKLADFTGGGSKPTPVETTPAIAHQPEQEVTPSANGNGKASGKAATGKAQADEVPPHDAETGEIADDADGSAETVDPRDEPESSMTAEAAAALGEMARRNNKPKRLPEPMRDGGPDAKFAKHWLDAWDRVDAELNKKA